jgi:3-deoxy-D-manno-octulosonic acid (KDO) 8-phosphate synthase
VNTVQLGRIGLGGANPLALIAGPCVIESEQHATDLAGRLVELTDRLSVPFIFKASYDKANRTSGHSFRGPGLDEGLRVLAGIKARFGALILTDIHEPGPAKSRTSCRFPPSSHGRRTCSARLPPPSASSTSRRDSFSRPAT